LSLPQQAVVAPSLPKDRVPHRKEDRVPHIWRSLTAPDVGYHPLSPINPGELGNLLTKTAGNQMKTNAPENLFKHAENGTLFPIGGKGKIKIDPANITAVPEGLKVRTPILERVSKEQSCIRARLQSLP
jgi:hypothetical protein